MGLFNMFIVIPQIVAALGGINFLSNTVFGEATINTMLLAGSCLIIAGISNLLITNATVLDGHPMAKKGKATQALHFCFISSSSIFSARITAKR